MSDKSNQLTLNFKDNIKYDNCSPFVTYIMYIGVIVALIIAIIYGGRKIGQKKDNEDSMTNNYPSPAPLRSISKQEADCKYLLRDYYVKTAYNCCALDKFKNSFVSMTALKICLAQGCRCLDFEIYSVDNKPVVAVSSVNNYYTKGSFNSLDLSDVLNTINANAFTSGAPNPNDPLILHFRIKTTQTQIFDQISSDILNNIDSYRILGPKFSYEFNGRNLGRVPLLLLTGKVIIIVDKNNTLFENSKLDEYVNIASNSVFMRALRDNDVTYNPDFQELTEFNRKNITLTMPNLSPDSKNVNAAVHMSYGCQYVCMSMQTKDDNLEFYNNLFEEKGKAFILKPEKLRFVQKLMEAPQAQDPNLSYETRTVGEGTGYYQFNM